MRFVVVNESTVVNATQAQQIVAALKLQAPQLSKAWNRLAPTVSYATTRPTSSTTIPLVILDDADQADALGYHDDNPNGLPYIKVFAKTILNAGGTVLQGPLSVSACASHEMCEAFVDPACTYWCEDANGSLICLEVADPCQDTSYELNWVAMSDFALPAYFSPFSPGPYSFTGALTKPAPYIAKGGYAIVATESGERQVFGEIPSWKDGTSRSHQRLESPMPDTINYPEGFMSTFITWLKARWKASVPLVIAGLGGATASGLIIGRDAAIAMVIVSVLTAAGVHAVPNQPPPAAMGDHP